jgi:hypothetical protein
MRIMRSLLSPVLFVACCLPAACADSHDDATAEEAALDVCTPPPAGPLKAASKWVRPGSFVNIEAEGDDKVDLRVEKMNDTVGTATTRKFGTGGRASFAVEFDNASKGFFRVVGVRGGKDVGEVRVRVSDAVPHLALGVPGANGKIDPVATLNGSSAALTGTVIDDLGSPASVSIGGTKQTVRNGQFQTTMSSAPGVHLVDAEVIDIACNSYPVTGAFVAATSRGQAGILHVRAGQSTVDQISDLVSQHFNEIVKVPADPNPIVNALGKSLFFDGVDFPKQPGAEHLKLSIDNGRFMVHLDVAGQLVAHSRLNSLPIDVKVDNFVLDGSVTIDRNGHFGLDVDHVDGKVSVDVSDFSVPLLNLFQGVIHKAVGTAVSQFAPPILEKALAGQKGDIPIPAPWAVGSRPATIHYDLGGIAVSRAGFTADVRTTVPASPQFGKQSDTPAPADGELGLGISFATINQVFYALWAKGAFNPTLSSEEIGKLDIPAGLPTLLKDTQMNVVVDNPLVPPALLPNSDGKSVHVAVGPATLHLFVQGAGVSSKIDAEVAVDADFGIRADGDALHVDVLKTEPRARLTGRIDLNASLEDVTSLMKQISTKLAQLLALKGLTLPIPAFDLSATGLPALNGIQVTASNVGVKVAPGGVGVRGTATFLPPP